MQFNSRSTTLFCILLTLATVSFGQPDAYPHNAVSCERCHSVPTEFGASTMTVQRIGVSFQGRFVPASEGGIHHRSGESISSTESGKRITAERVALSLLGDGFIEAIDGRDIDKNARQQRQLNLGAVGVNVSVSALEAARNSANTMQIGRFGWKSQHSSLMSSCADSLRNELGIRNRLYPNEYPTHAITDPPSPFDTPDTRTGKTELDRLVDEIRHTSPPERNLALSATPDAQAGEKLFVDVGCAICHVPTYKTVPPGTRINGGTYRVPRFVGNKVIHPYSDFLLHKDHFTFGWNSSRNFPQTWKRKKEHANRVYRRKSEELLAPAKPGMAGDDVDALSDDLTAAHFQMSVSRKRLRKTGTVTVGEKVRMKLDRRADAVGRNVRRHRQYDDSASSAVRTLCSLGGEQLAEVVRRADLLCNARNADELKRVRCGKDRIDRALYFLRQVVVAGSTFERDALRRNSDVGEAFRT